MRGALCGTMFTRVYAREPVDVSNGPREPVSRARSSFVSGPFVPASEGGMVSAPTERVFNIAVIPGDGIGVEVIPEGLRVLERLAEQSDGRFRFRFESFPWGSKYYLQTGRMMDPDGLERLPRFDAIYFGAVGWPDVPD